VARNLRTRFTLDREDAVISVWSPDARHVVFNSRRTGHYDLYQKASNGAGNEDLLFSDEREKAPVSWSPDGQLLLYQAVGGVGLVADLWVVPLFGDRKARLFLQSAAGGQFSPDGRWVVYGSNESGKPEVYVAPFPRPGGKWLISTAGGHAPRWRADGNEIFYLGLDNTLMSATVNGKGETFEVGVVKPLFRPRLGPGGPTPYDVARDGHHFLMNLISEKAAPAPITVVLNWTAALKK
jgi:eukaryotic-like serine/threonine-protein kinase